MSTRREFMQQAAVLAAAPFLPDIAVDDRLEVHIFSKHLQFLDYRDLAKAAADLGFDGIDLTVRPGGHVLPENAAAHLPKAVEAIRKKGLKCELTATAVNNVDDPVHRQVLEAAATQGIRYYRTGYYQYPKEGSMPEAMQVFKKQIHDLATFSQRLGLQGSYQNHAGNYVGASVWEIWQLLEQTPSGGMGCQFDIRHAVVEGGASWKTGLRLLHERINTIVAKDFIWQKSPKGWELTNVPLGEGMVDFKTYFGLLKQYGIKVPVSLHLEYPIGGAEHGVKDLPATAHKTAFEAMSRDLKRLQQLWKES